MANQTASNEPFRGSEPTPEMIDRFERRTREHIERVRRCLVVLNKVTPQSDELLTRAREHDASKFSAEERFGYIWSTEYHRCRHAGEPFTYLPGVQQQVDAAVAHHMRVNRHYPEYHADPNDMTDFDLMEMVCDWTAMAQEFGEPDGSARSWADNVIGHRLMLNDEKTELVYETIKTLEIFAPVFQHQSEMDQLRNAEKLPMPMATFLYHYSATVDHLVTVQIVLYVFFRANQPVALRICTVIGLVVYFAVMKLLSRHFGRRDSLAISHTPLTAAQVAIVVSSFFLGAVVSLWLFKP